MPSKLPILGLTALLACTIARGEIAHAANRCEPAVMRSIREAEVLVGSIRVDKPGLARVYAADGSEFTAGQARWMQGQMQEIEKACASGDSTGAAERLATVQALVRQRSR